MISSRLKSLVSYLDKSDRVVDVGCDHALLAVYLIKNKILEKIIVSDNKEKALQSGIKNIERYKLSQYIIPKLGDGLEVVDSKIDTVIISGMGANTILKMLDSENLKFIKKFIIQSNNDHFLLRSGFIKKGFYISEESVVKDNDRYYINIVFKLGRKDYSKFELKYGPLLTKKKNEYFKFLLNKQTNIFNNIPKRKWKKKLELWFEINKLRKLIN